MTGRAEYSGAVDSMAWQVAGYLSNDADPDWVASQAADKLVELIDRMITERLRAVLPGYNS